MRERVADDYRLLVNFLRHEMAVATLVDQRGRCACYNKGAVRGPARFVIDRDGGPANNNDITILQIRNAVRERREGERIGTEIGFVRPVTHRKRASLARTDKQTFFALENHRETIRAGETAHGFLRRIFGRETAIEIIGDEMHGDFGIGFGLEFVAAREQLVAQLAEILDDAVMHQRYARGRMRMRVDLCRLAMRGPARMADARMACERMVVQHRVETVKLAGRAAAFDFAIYKRGDARRVVAAIFES